MAKTPHNMATFLSTPKRTPKDQTNKYPGKVRTGKDGGYSVSTGKVIKDKSF